MYDLALDLCILEICKELNVSSPNEGWNWCHHLHFELERTTKRLCDSISMMGLTHLIPCPLETICFRRQGTYLE